MKMREIEKLFTNSTESQEFKTPSAMTGAELWEFLNNPNKTKEIREMRRYNEWIKQQFGNKLNIAQYGDDELAHLKAFRKLPKPDPNKPDYPLQGFHKKIHKNGEYNSVSEIFNQLMVLMCDNFLINQKGEVSLAALQRQFNQNHKYPNISGYLKRRGIKPEDFQAKARKIVTQRRDLQEKSKKLENELNLNPTDSSQSQKKNAELYKIKNLLRQLDEEEQDYSKKLDEAAKKKETKGKWLVEKTRRPTNNKSNSNSNSNQSQLVPDTVQTIDSKPRLELIDKRNNTKVILTVGSKQNGPREKQRSTVTTSLSQAGQTFSSARTSQSLKKRKLNEIETTNNPGNKRIKQRNS